MSAKGVKILECLMGGHGEVTEDLSSEYEFNEEKRQQLAKRHDLATKTRPSQLLGSKRVFDAELDDDERKKRRFHFLALDAYGRHKQLVNNYIMYYGGKWSHFEQSQPKRYKTDLDTIKEHHRFLWDDDDSAHTWEQQLAKKYWDKLFKEYCIADLSLYKENRIGMRWRTEQEVVDGKGQFVCGNKRCHVKDGLRSWEVNFAYREDGHHKNALVKLRLCPACSTKLNYSHQRKEAASSMSRSSAGGSSHLPDAPRSPSSPTAVAQSPTPAPSLPNDTDVWKKHPLITVEKSKDEEFEDYLQELFL